MKFVAHEYQKRAIKFLLDNPAAGLFMEMGLGKSVITLTAIDILMHDTFDVGRVLVIAPLRVAEDTWTREVEKWDHLKHLKVSRILGSEAKRKKALSGFYDIGVINRENVVWLVEELARQKRAWPFDMVVIDELSSFKSGSSKRFKALRKVRPQFDRIVGLTGTPAANGLMDLWAEMYLLDKGLRLGQTISGYRSTYFTPAWGNGMVVYKWNLRSGALQKITSKISDITMSMKAEDYLQLPDRVDTTIGVELAPKAMNTYSQMEKQSLVVLNDSEIVALDAAAVMNKLLQMANGFVYGEDGGTLRIHDSKLDALEEIIEQADGSVLVYYEFIADKQALLERFPQAEVLADSKSIEKWNAGQTKVLIAHPASVAYGLNLQDGGHTIVWFGLPWSLELYSQANARLHRQGQKLPVLIYHLIAKGTVDEQVLERLVKKDITQSALLEVLKSRRAEYG